MGDNLRDCAGGRRVVGWYAAAHRAAERLRQRSGRGLLTIGGCSQCGKTFAAGILRRFLAESLAVSVGVLHLDDFYLPSSLYDVSSFEEGFDNPNAVDWHLLGAVVEAWRRSGSIALPRLVFDSEVGGIPSSRREYYSGELGEVVILEGLFAHYFASDFGILVLGPGEAVRFRRRVERDVRERGYSEEQVRIMWRKQVQPGCLRYAQSSSPRFPGTVDCFVDGESSLEGL